MTDNGRLTELDGTAGHGFERPVVLFLFTAYLVEVLRNAWLADDAFITLRTVDNFVQGLGLVYNVQERVQAYTHPLWMGLVSLFYSVTREGYFTVLALGLATSAAAVSVVVFRLSATRLNGLFVLVLLFSSRAFVDYSTSGLENPLTHLLLGVFVALSARGVEGGRSLALLASIAGLGMVNRMDTALLFLPGLLRAAWRCRRWRALGPLTLGLSPFFAWEVFSFVYYGFPFPNTAYAKLGADLPRPELVEQGFYYLVDSLHRDPVTLVVILAGLTLVALRRRVSELALYSGIVFYLAYVVWIGGDFMSGRFFSAPFYLAAAFLAGAAFSRPALLAMTAVAVVFHLGAASQGRLSSEPRVPVTGISDEKAFYFPHLGLPEVHRGARVRQMKPGPYEEGSGIEVEIERAIGFSGYVLGPGFHVVDILGLADPLLARLPTQDRFSWRIGHFTRKVPAGYLATLRSGSNQIEDEDLAEYYARLSLVVRGELFTGARWRTIAAFLLGRYDRLIDRKFYRRPYGLVIPHRRVEKVRPEGSRWSSPRNVLLPPHDGALIRLAEVSHCSRLRLGLATGVGYRLAYYRGDKPVAYYGRGRTHTTWQSLPFHSGRGIHTLEVNVPAEVADAGFDALLIYPLGTGVDARYSVGHVVLCGGEQPE